MGNFWSCIFYLVGTIMAIWCIADAGKEFSNKRWGWFGFNTYLAIYWTAWIIHHIFG